MTGTKWNHNLIATFVFRISFSLSQGLWNSGTGSNYIYYLEDRRNTLVGLVQGIQGIFIPLASFPGGYLADRTRRDAVLKVFGVAGFVAIALLIAAVLSPQQPLPAHPSVDLKYLLLCIGYAFWGVTQASNPIVESILADSVPTGGRSAVYTSLFFLGMLGRAIGPLMAAVIFIVDGNVWRVSTLGVALTAGMLASVLPIASLFFFNDNRSLGEESEAHGRAGDEEEEAAKEGASLALSAEELRKPRLCCSRAAIPFILSISDLIYGLASGCTIKFFPIFFAKEVQLGPVAVNVLMAAQPIVIGIFAAVGQRASIYIGRVQVLLLLRLVGWTAMAVMGCFPSLWRRAGLIVAIFLVRTGVNNAGYPVQKAVLMDHVPKKNRGKWSAVDSLTAFGWSGSAFLGGILVDHAGFDWCFLITAMAQCLGWAVLIPLLALVPREEVTHGASGSELRQPLLDTLEPDNLRTDDGCESPRMGEDCRQESGSGDCGGPRTGTPMRAKQHRTDRRDSLTTNSNGEEDFVRLLGSMKSPRHSLDEWSNQ